MRPVIRGNHPTDGQGNDIVFNHYSKSRGPLIGRIGEYCSYCEMHLDSSLAVEHVKPKKHNPEEELHWDNFLLSCTNCNSTKGQEDVDLNEYLWPDTDNTFYALQYEEGGLVSPSDRLNGNPALKQKAQDTITLTGLDKQPVNAPAASDRRWINRREAWDIAVESKSDLVNNDTPEMRRQIIRSATARGYWSIWMTVFEDDADMRRRLIEGFPGTCNACFDANNGYAPVSREGGQC
ncbi:HNH endonuclease [Desulfosarcina ovata]|uniref:HNH nuclease domain-containing protein n=1 Tax=Desulfosarcina ovata subsp. ovata TaxID=2752305 RepID=A0A5K8A5H7_9BACT|nr:HNH endonuclease [Desulfosarcina ovata]BBO87500.1 hypothetical protein DSCOOX_06800 [Desulfosarcina ovata subsp. ovata]